MAFEQADAVLARYGAAEFHRGLDATKKQLRALARYSTGFCADIHHIAASGGVVLTERTDVLERGEWRMAFWVCGTFEVTGGRIVLWRDYFDGATVLAVGFRATGGAVARKLLGR